MKSVLSFLSLFSFASCHLTTADEGPLWLAWGDSYTIGESVKASERWPAQVADKDSSMSWNIEYTARTGWTTQNLLGALQNKDYQPGSADRVSLLIGVNNQFQGLDSEAFRADFKTLLDKAVSVSKTGESGVLVLTIPDYGVTPFGQNSPGITDNLYLFNNIIQQTATAEGITLVDITPISLRAFNEPGLTASDGLHPSGEQYRLWAELVLEELRKQPGKSLLSAFHRTDKPFEIGHTASVWPREDGINLTDDPHFLRL